MIKKHAVAFAIRKMTVAMALYGMKILANVFVRLVKFVTLDSFLIWTLAVVSVKINLIAKKVSNSTTKLVLVRVFKTKNVKKILFGMKTHVHVYSVQRQNVITVSFTIKNFVRAFVNRTRRAKV